MGKLYDDFKAESESKGYFVNPDVEFVEFLLDNIQKIMIDMVMDLVHVDFQLE